MILRAGWGLKLKRAGRKRQKRSGSVRFRSVRRALMFNIYGHNLSATVRPLYGNICWNGTALVPRETDMNTIYGYWISIGLLPASDAITASVCERNMDLARMACPLKP